MLKVWKDVGIAFGISLVISFIALIVFLLAELDPIMLGRMFPFLWILIYFCLPEYRRMSRNK